jgi:hypothetical protein
VLEKSERPFTPEERTHLVESLDRAPPRRSKWPRRIWACLSVLLFGIWILSFRVLLNANPRWSELATVVLVVTTLPVCVIAGFGIYTLFSGYPREIPYETYFTQQLAPQIRLALEDGRASVCRVKAVGAIVIEEYMEEDLGSAVLFDLGDGTSFYMRGGEIYDFEDEPFIFRLPSQFDLVRTAANDLWLGLVNCAGSLEPELTVSMKDMPEEYVWGDSPASESVLPGRPRDVLSRLGYEDTE